MRLQDGADPQPLLSEAASRVRPAALRDRGAEPARHLRRDRDGAREGGRVTGKLWAVIRREYLERVRTKAFVIGTILGPMLMGGMMMVPPMLAASQGSELLRVAVLDATGRSRRRWRRRSRSARRRQGALRRASRRGRAPRGAGSRGLKEGGARGEPRRLPRAARGRRRRRRRPATSGAPSATGRSDRIAGASSDVLVVASAHRSGPRPRAGQGAHAGPGPKTIRLSEDGEEEDEGRRDPPRRSSCS